ISRHASADTEQERLPARPVMPAVAMGSRGAWDHQHRGRRHDLGWWRHDHRGGIHDYWGWRDHDRCGGCRPWSPGAWLRRCRVDSYPGGALWRFRSETVVWARAELAQCRYLGWTVPQWSHHAHRGGRGSVAWGHRWARP